MTNPYEPNTASIPNILFDYWMPRLTDGQFKVLMAIARKTYGWNKKKDSISLTQLEKMTGLSRKGISRIIDSLIENNLIIKVKSKTFLGDDAPNIYEINTQMNEKDGIADGGGSDRSTLGVVTVGNQGVVTVGNPQKTINTKHTTTKEKDIAQTPSEPRKKVPDISFSFDEKKIIGITPQDIQAWKILYPFLDIQLKILEITQWSLSHPTQTKSRKLWRKFITGWLRRNNEELANRQAYQSRKQEQVLSRHTGFQKDTRPVHPSRTIDLREPEEEICI